MSTHAPAKRARRQRIGKYQVRAHIATGGMGAVYKAVDIETGQIVALKVLAPELAERPVLLQRFQREADLAAQLKHPNIVELFAFGEQNGIHFLAMEFVDGIDLNEYVRRRGGKLGVKESKRIITQAARALNHLHQLGMVHRDVKPSNFLLTRVPGGERGKPRIKLIDLGLARQPKEDDLRMTRAGSTVGTIDYMAPEQARDSGFADIRSDIYALGCTWYYLLAGQPPFPEGSVPERVYRHVHVRPPDIRTLNEKVPLSVADILSRMLAKDPAKRHPSPAALLAELEAKETISRELLAAMAKSWRMETPAPLETPALEPTVVAYDIVDAPTPSPSATWRLLPLAVLSATFLAGLIGLLFWLALGARS